jgi:hypothetical protein
MSKPRPGSGTSRSVYCGSLALVAARPIGCWVTPTHDQPADSSALPNRGQADAMSADGCNGSSRTSPEAAASSLGRRTKRRVTKGTSGVTGTVWKEPS